MTSPLNMGLLAAVAAVLCLGGLLLVMFGSRRRPDSPSRPRATRRRRRISRRTWLLVLTGFVLGIIAWVTTGYVVAVLLLPVAAAVAPYLLTNPTGRHDIDRLEAMEEWTRSLSGVLTSGMGLEQAITATTRTVPEPIAPEVRRLVTRLRAQWSTRHALRLLADDLADPTGDLIVTTLILGATRRGSGLASVLESLAETVAADVSNRRDIETERAKPRSTARWITLITVLGALYLTLNRTYSEPYLTALGQIIYLALASSLIASLLWLRHLSTNPPPIRILNPTPPAVSPATPVAEGGAVAAAGRSRIPAPPAPPAPGVSPGDNGAWTPGAPVGTAAQGSTRWA